MVARLGAAPSVSSSQARRVAVSLARGHDPSRVGNGGLCGHCSRDLPLDRRLLFIAELTGQGWWVVSLTLCRCSGWTSALRAARDLYAATNPEGGCATWSRTSISKLMRLPWFSFRKCGPPRLCTVFSRLRCE